MARSSLVIFALSLLITPLAFAGGAAVPTLELERVEIVAGPEGWPGMFEPETRLEPGLPPTVMADRLAYRAAEYVFEAWHYRRSTPRPSWPGRLVFGDGRFTRLYDRWANELDDAAERSRELSVRYHLAAHGLVMR